MRRVWCCTRLASLAFSTLVKKQTFHFTRRPIAFFHTHKPTMAYSIEERGTQNTMSYRIFFKKEPNGGIVSPFHDIPLYANAEKSVLNMVVEIPRWTNSKMEISIAEKMNPIKQDVKKGKVRFVKNVFPHHGYIWNYGALPQTWEDPEHKDKNTDTFGDKDPLDVCEIGNKVHKRGAVIQVKVLGTMCLIDEGETDWKILAVDVNDPLAEKLNDVEDIKEHMPGFLEATDEWFRIYKIPDGKPMNTMAFDGKAKKKEFAEEIIAECHKHWQRLMDDGENVQRDGISCDNVSVTSHYQISQKDADEIIQNQPALTEPAELPPEVDNNNFIANKTNVQVKPSL